MVTPTPHPNSPTSHPVPMTPTDLSHMLQEHKHVITFSLLVVKVAVTTHVRRIQYRPQKVGREERGGDSRKGREVTAGKGGEVTAGKGGGGHNGKGRADYLRIIVAAAIWDVLLLVSPWASKAWNTCPGQSTLTVNSLSYACVHTCAHVHTHHLHVVGR